MIIRAAEENDAPGIAEIWNDNIRHTLNTFNSREKTPDMVAGAIAARKAEGKAFLVAAAQGRIDGFATYFQFRGGPGYAHTAEHTVMLRQTARGRGTGRALMTALEDHARRAGMHSIIAGVSGENAAGIAFHKAVGYREVALLPEVGRKFDRWIDLVLLQKRL